MVFLYEHGKLLYKGRLMLPKDCSLIPTILREYHNSPIGGHSGEDKTICRIAYFYWLGMRKRVVEWVKECEVCQKHKNLNMSPAGLLLQPIALPSLVWKDLTMDFIEGLPRSHGMDTILVLVDRLSKYAYFISLQHPFTARGVAELFLEEVVRLHGVPRSIISDRDKVFMSHFWQELFKLQGTELRHSTAYQPRLMVSRRL